MGVLLHGYRYSVYTWIARMALAERGVAYDRVEVDPFGELPEGYTHLFGRVPVLEHDGFSIYETAAILRYVAAAFDGPPLVPATARGAARMAQVSGIIDSYGYWPLVRQVFSHAVFRPAAGEPADPAVVEKGLAASDRVLAALEAIAAEGEVLAGPLTLADLHLAPMLAYFASAPEGAERLGRYPALAGRFGELKKRESFRATEPGLPGQANSP